MTVILGRFSRPDRMPRAAGRPAPGRSARPAPWTPARCRGLRRPAAVAGLSLAAANANDPAPVAASLPRPVLTGPSCRPPSAEGRTPMATVCRFMSWGGRGVVLIRQIPAAMTVLLAIGLAGCAGLDLPLLIGADGRNDPGLPLLVAAADPDPRAAAAPAGASTASLAARPRPVIPGPDDASITPSPPAPGSTTPDPASDAPASEPPAPAPWTVRAGETLMQTLRRWGRRAGIAVFWDACPGADRRRCIDWRNQHAGRLDGSFDTALAALLRGHGDADPRPIAIRASNGAVRILADAGAGSLR